MRAWICVILLSAAIALPSQASQKKRPDAFCHNEYLTRQEQSTCVDRVAGVETKDELKKLEARYRDKVKAAQDAAKK